MYANDDPILQQTRDVLITQPVNIEVMISNRGINQFCIRNYRRSLMYVMQMLILSEKRELQRL